MPLDIGSNIFNSSTSKLLNETSYVKTNLVNLWDPSLPSSYVGTGTSWVDFVGGSRNGTLENGPTFSTENGGIFNFDGSNDFVSIPTWTLSPPWTVNFWCRTSSGGDNGLMSHWSGGPVNNAMFITGGKMAYYYYNGEWRLVVSNGSSVNTGNWVFLSFVAPAASNGSLQFYADGVLNFTTTIPGGHFSSNIGSIGVNWSWAYFAGAIAHVSHYNTNHTQSQIIQNYNSTRKRFGR